MAITGGQVTFEQSRKLADYENRKATVTFNVEEADGAEEQVKAALDLAKEYVFNALDLTKTGKTPGQRGRPASTTPPGPAPKEEKPETDDVFEEQAKTLVKPDPKEEKPAISTGEERVDPEDDIFLASEERTAITDKELMDKITRKNAELQKVHGEGAPVKIRDLISSYAKRAADIPAEVRAKFLEELAALS